MLATCGLTCGRVLCGRWVFILERTGPLGELGAVRRYSYWSERRVRSIAADNDINLRRRWRLGFRSPALSLLPQAEIIEETKALQRHEIALRVETAIGQIAVADFVTPPPAAFAKGSGEITFSIFRRWQKKAQRHTVVIHARTESSNCASVEICLFGSIDNCEGYLSTAEKQAPRWSSSSLIWIEGFLADRGRKFHELNGDASVQAMILETVYEGLTTTNVLRHTISAEWFAEVYHDVEIDREQWTRLRRGHLPATVDRIVIGAPLWVRSISG